MQHKKSIIIFFVIILCSLMTGTAFRTAEKKTYCCRWDEQLNFLNYLVIKASSINLIKALDLDKQQCSALESYCMQLEASGIKPPLPCLSYEAGTGEIAAAYIKLISILESGDTISADLRKEVFVMREKESEIVKASLLGARKRSNRGEACYACHSLPVHFPAGDIAAMRMPPVSPSRRYETDKAHVVGLFGESGMLLLWELRDEVDALLNPSQRWLATDFRCCLLPSAEMSPDGRIGQSSVSGVWINMLEDVYAYGNQEWDYARPHYLKAVEKAIRATLPGIQNRQVKARVNAVDAILEKSRKLDKIDFAIRKYELTGELIQAINVDQLNGESSRSSDLRKFITAMYLLFPGNREVYQKAAL